MLNVARIYILRMTSTHQESQEQLDAAAATQTFPCPWPGCGRLFRAQFSLNRHMVLHTDAKKYTCKVCQRTFSLPQYLREHEYTHSKEMPYVCGVAGCIMRFRQAGKLSLHRRTHPEYKPKKYDYSLNKDKRTRTRPKVMQQAKVEASDDRCDMMFKVTKAPGQPHSPDCGNEDTKALHTHHSHCPATDYCPNPNAGLKPLPSLAISVGLGLPVTGSHGPSCDGKLAETHYEMINGGKFLPLIDYLRSDPVAQTRPVLPLPQAFNAPAKSCFSHLDLFTLVKSHDA